MIAYCKVSIMIKQLGFYFLKIHHLIPLRIRIINIRTCKYNTLTLKNIKLMQKMQKFTGIYVSRSKQDNANHITCSTRHGIILKFVKDRKVNNIDINQTKVTLNYHY